MVRSEGESGVSPPTDFWKPDGEFLPIEDEKVIGINNLLSIAWLRRGLEMAATVSRVLIGGRTDSTGTGFLVASDLLLTNNHVLPDDATALASIAEFNYQLKWSGQFETTRRYNVVRFERTNEELDYTLVRVAESPGDIFGYVDPANRAEAGVNDYVVIIQHPSGGPKRIGLMDNKVSAVFGNLLQYATDTEPGSSGSPVFDQKWQVVGLHHAGGQLRGPDNARYFTNEGIRFGAIVRDAAGLLGVADLLYAVAFGDLRALLIKHIELGVPPDGLDAAAMELLQLSASFGIALTDRLTTTPAGQAGALALLASGIGIGVALMQWSRSGGHESANAVAGDGWQPTPALVATVTRILTPGMLPATVYAEVLTAVESDPALAEGLPTQPDPLKPVAAASFFLAGVSAGAAARPG